MASHPQDNEDEGFYALLKPIQDVARNWDVDLSLHIQEYLQYVYQICGDNIADMNFAQAAVLVQNSANIYGKKVDVLFETVMLLLQNISKKQIDKTRKDGQEGEGGPEQPANRRRKVAPTLETEEFDMFDLVCSERDLTINIEKEKQKNLERKKNQIVLNAATKVKAKEKTCCYVRNHANEVMGKKEEFRLNWRISSAGTLSEEFNVSKNMFRRMEPLEITTWEEQDDIGPVDNASDHNLDCSDHNNRDIDTPHLEISLFPLADLRPDYEEEIESPTERRVAQTRKEPENLKDNVEIEFQPNDYNVNIVEKPIKKRNVIKLPKNLREKNKRKSIVETLTYTVTDCFMGPQLNGKLKFMVDSNFIWQSNLVSKRKKDLFKGLENLNEGDDDDEEPEFAGFDDISGAEDYEDFDNAVEVDVPLPEKGNILDPPKENWTGDDLNTYNCEAKKKIEEFRSRKKKLEEKDSLIAKRVEEWHQKIQPKLDEAENRVTFDINRYGTKVLDSFTEGIGSTKTFQEVVNGQTREEVSRFFLASLVLANQSNLEISQSESGDLNKDCVQLKLLSMDRHHEKLHDNIKQTSEK